MNGKTITKEIMNIVAKKYIVICAWSDYDCGAPCASLVGNTFYSSWERAYDAMTEDIKKTMEVSSLEELGEKEFDYDVPDRNIPNDHTHKCGSAWVHADADGEYIWNITEIQEEEQKE